MGTAPSPSGGAHATVHAIQQTGGDFLSRCHRHLIQAPQLRLGAAIPSPRLQHECPAALKFFMLLQAIICERRFIINLR